ncbi:MAG TPA: DUF6221 family protein [Kineosporiaceae bacterium]|nr:DUF6221 family protein [Kineosporiaceae bacterium]
MQHTIYALIEWFRAQLDDDERIALAANPGPWRRFTDKEHLDPLTIFGGRWMGDDEKLRNVASVELAWVKDGNAEHITRWDPARVLAELRAKRAVLDEVEQESRNADERLRSGGHLGYPGAILWRCVCNLAQPYAGREGWQDEWNVTEESGGPVTSTERP